MIGAIFGGTSAKIESNCIVFSGRTTLQDA